MLVSYSDSTGRRILGDMLALSGALFYGLYTILLKRQIGSESRIDMPLFFGWVGVFNVVLLWPIIPLFHYTGIETFELPHGPALWLMLLLNAFVGTFMYVINPCKLPRQDANTGYVLLDPIIYGY